METYRDFTESRGIGYCQREALREFLLVAANDDDDPHPAKEGGWGGIRIGGLKLDGSQLRNFENIR